MATQQQKADWLLANPDDENYDKVVESYKAGKEKPAELSMSADYSMADSAGRGSLQGATFGTADEIYGGVGAAYNAVTTDETFSDSYDRLTTEQRDKNKEAEDANPASYFAGDMAGSSVLPFGVGHLAKGTKLAKAVTKGTGKVMDIASKTGVGKGVGKLKKLADDKVADASQGLTKLTENVPMLNNLKKAKSSAVLAAETAADKAKKQFAEKAEMFRGKIAVSKKKVQNAKEAASGKVKEYRGNVSTERTTLASAKRDLAKAEKGLKEVDKKAKDAYKASEKLAKAAQAKAVKQSKDAAKAVNDKSKAASAKIKAGNKKKVEARKELIRKERATLDKTNAATKKANLKADKAYKAKKVKAKKADDTANAKGKAKYASDKTAAKKLDDAAKSKYKDANSKTTRKADDEAYDMEIEQWKAGKKEIHSENGMARNRFELYGEGKNGKPIVKDLPPKPVKKVYNTVEPSKTVVKPYTPVKTVVDKPVPKGLKKAKSRQPVNQKKVPAYKETKAKAVKDYKEGKPPEMSKPVDRSAVDSSQSRLDDLVTNKQPDLNDYGNKAADLERLKMTQPSRAPMDEAVESLKAARASNPPNIAALPQTTGEAIFAATGAAIGNTAIPIGGGVAGAALGVEAVRKLDKVRKAVAGSKVTKAAGRLAALSASGKAVDKGIETVQSDYNKSNSDPAYAAQKRLDKLATKKNQ